MSQTVYRIRIVRLHDVPPAFFEVSTETANTLMVRSKTETDKPFRIYIVRTYLKQKPRYAPEKKINAYLNQ